MRYLGFVPAEDLAQYNQDDNGSNQSAPPSNTVDTGMTAMPPYTASTDAAPATSTSAAPATATTAQKESIKNRPVLMAPLDDTMPPPLVASVVGDTNNRLLLIVASVVAYALWRES